MQKEQFDRLRNLRRELHQQPEVAGEESQTAEYILSFFEKLGPDHTLEALGGKGLAFVFKGEHPGPRSLFRAELDGLPIRETNTFSHASKDPEKGHLCGHDGHMAIVCGLGEQLAAQRPETGEVVLLFQPAEETGEGAQAILADEKFESLGPIDAAFALHNLPGYPLHEVVLKKNSFAAASVGMIIELSGKTAHAAHPEDGLSPAEAMSKTIVALQYLPDAMKKFSLVTVVHAQLGSRAFGTTPGEATLMLTLRAYEDETLKQLRDYSEKLAHSIADSYGLGCEVDWVENFAATQNHPKAWEQVNETAKSLRLSTKHIRIPFRWSEDFGVFSAEMPTVLFGLGAGEKLAQLHAPTYDFPDELIPTGVALFEGVVRRMHNK
ncbi:MAG: amidohydrolase [Nitritalea sp.]